MMHDVRRYFIFSVGNLKSLFKIVRHCFIRELNYCVPCFCLLVCHP